MCSKKIWLAIAVAAVIAVTTSSGVAAIGSFLVIAACPLMMLFMGSRLMGSKAGTSGCSTDEHSELAQLRAEVAELRERVEP